MFKNLSHKLLSKYPILWNSKLLIMLPIIILLYAIITCITFLLTPTTFDTYRDTLDTPITKLTILVSLVIFILWTILLNRNQTLKNFYPRSSFSLYKEWLIFFVIIACIIMLNLSYTTGVKLRWNTYSEIEQQQDIETLQKTSLLLPQYKYRYDAPFQSDRQTTIEKKRSEILILKDSTYRISQNTNLNFQALVDDSLVYLEPSLLY